RLPPARERELPDRHVLRGPDPGDGCADVERPGPGEERVDLLLGGEVGADDRSAAELGGERFGPVATSVVVDDDACPLGVEGPRAGRADAARRAGDENGLVRQARVHVRTLDAGSQVEPACCANGSTGTASWSSRMLSTRWRSST